MDSSAITARRLLTALPSRRMIDVFLSRKVGKYKHCLRSCVVLRTAQKLLHERKHFGSKSSAAARCLTAFLSCYMIPLHTWQERELRCSVVKDI